jgi:hypothetical protein
MDRVARLAAAEAPLNEAMGCIQSPTTWGIPTLAGFLKRSPSVTAIILY